MIAACYILHYGKEWLAWSMRSVRSQVDEIFVFYTNKPSHGSLTTLRNPDSRQDLFDVSKPFQPIWHDADGYPHEGIHRNFAIEYCKKAGADLVVVVDADEIWDQSVLQTAISVGKSSPNRSWRIGMRHFWRSLKWICDDAAMPTRIICPNIPESFGEGYMSGDLKVFHMGYAQSPETVYYKQSIHGHKSEWRDNWYDNKFLSWTPGVMDVHPTCENYWNPVSYDDDGTVEYLVGDHPYWGMDIIK